MKRLLFIMLIIVLIVGCAKKEPEQEKVALKYDEVVVDFVAKLDDGTVFDTSISKVAKENDLDLQNLEPLTFDLGIDDEIMFPIQNAVMGMKEGEMKTISIPPDQAYGQYVENRTANVYMEVFERSNIEPTIGQFLQYEGPDGVLIQGVIVDVEEEYAVLDMNRPLAGKTLEYDIYLREIKGVNLEEELAKMRNGS